MAKANKISRRNFIEAVAALGAVGLSACAANPPQSARLSPSERGSGKLPSRGEFVVRNAYVVTMDNKLGDIPNGDVHAPPLAYLIMLFGITYGAQYGGSTTSILVNIPGEASSVITCLDGYAMARQGRAGPALGIAAFGSFIGGTVALVGVAFLAPALAELGLRFGPPEYAALLLFGLTALVYLAHGPMDKALLMALFGSLLASVGLDPVTGQPRFTFDILVLRDGVGLTPVVIGLFGVSEVLVNLQAHGPLEKLVKEGWIERAGQ